MRVKVKSTFAVGSTVHLSDEAKTNKQALIDLPEGATVLDLLERLPSLGPREQFDDIMINVFVNGRLCGFDHLLSPGDEIDIHIPVSGG